MDYVSLILIFIILTFAFIALLFKRKSIHVYTEWSCLMWVVVSIFIVRSFFWEPYINKGTSMEPTIPQGSVLIVNKQAYGIDWPYFNIHSFGTIAQKNNIVAFRHNEQVWVKRVIGVPGDEITFTSQGWFIDNHFVGNKTSNSLSWLTYGGRPHDGYYGVSNGKKLKAQWRKNDYWTMIIPNHYIFVMGDNRKESTDSRDVGLIPMSWVIGKVEKFYAK